MAIKLVAQSNNSFDRSANSAAFILKVEGLMRTTYQKSDNLLMKDSLARVGWNELFGAAHIEGSRLTFLVSIEMISST